MNGFDGQARKIQPTDGPRVGYEGATLVKIGAWYVLTCAEWNGGGNHTDGTYDLMYSCSKNLAGPWKPRRVVVPHACHGALFMCPLDAARGGVPAPRFKLRSHWSQMRLLTTVRR